MLNKLKNLAGKTKEIVSSTAVMVGDLNGDGKIDKEDARIAAKWAKNTASSAGNEAAKIGKEAVRSDLVKDASAGAAIGAVVAVPVPLVGPVAGAVIGAGLGVYKNLIRKDTKTIHSNETKNNSIDMHDQLIKLADLKEKGILSESEFACQKSKILKGDG